MHGAQIDVNGTSMNVNGMNVNGTQINVNGTQMPNSHPKKNLVLAPKAPEKCHIKSVWPITWPKNTQIEENTKIMSN